MDQRARLDGTVGAAGREAERDLLATWFTEFHVPIYRYLVRLVGHEDVAADLLQDTFLRAAVSLRDRRAPERPRAWLYRIATNLAYDEWRRRQRLTWLSLTGRETAPDFEPTLEVADSVRRCLARLSRADAEALLLFEYAGLNCAEIAALRGRTHSAVRMRISRARRRFRQFYEREVT